MHLNRFAPLRAAALFPVVVFVAIGAVLAVDQLGNLSITLLLAAWLALWSVPFWIEGRIDWFQPLTYMSLWAARSVLRAIHLVWTGEIESTLLYASPNGLESLFERVLLIKVIGLSALFCGYYRWHRARVPVWMQVSLPQRLNLYRLGWALACLAVAAVAAYAYLIGSVGGLWAYLSGWSGRRALLSGKFYLVALLITFGSVLLLTLARAWAQRAGLPRQLGLLAIALAYSGILASLGVRSYVVVFWAIALGLYHYLRRRVRVVHLVAVGVTVFLFATVMYDVRSAAFRGEIREGEVPTVTVGSEAVGRFVTEDLLNRGLDNMLVVVDVSPHYLPLQWGKSWLNLLALPVPRGIWPDKPVMTVGGLLRDEFYPGAGAVPVGYDGTLYVNFQLPGVMLGMVLLGILFRCFYEWFMANRKNLYAVFLYVVILTQVPDGLSPDALGQVAIYVLPLLPVIYFVSHGRRARPV